MYKYLFLLNFFLYFSFLLASPFLSHAKEREIQRNRTYPPEVWLICNESGLKELIEMRKSQIAEGSRYLNTEEIPSEGCVHDRVEAVFRKMATKYNEELPLDLRIFPHPEGEEACPWDPEERCSVSYNPPVRYIEARIYKDGKSYEGAFIEVSGNYKLINPPPESTAVEGARTPDSLSQKKYPGELLATLIEEFSQSLDRVNESIGSDSSLSMLQNNSQEKYPLKVSKKDENSNRTTAGKRGN